MLKIELQVFILTPFNVQDDNNNSVKVLREVSKTVIIDSRTTCQDIINALMAKRIPQNVLKYYSLYITVMKENERRFIRSLEPTELPMIILLHETGTIDLYIKKKAKSEYVSIYMDLRRELLRSFSREQLHSRLEIAQESTKEQKNNLISKYKKEISGIRQKMTELGFETLPGM